jgi:putative hydrolase
MPRAAPSRTDRATGSADDRASSDVLARERFDFHSHTFLTDGTGSPTDMWSRAEHTGHQVLAITDHVSMNDPAPIVARLLQEAEAFVDGPLIPLVGVEVSLVPPRHIPKVARAARRAGAQIVIVHGETLAEEVPPGTNRAAVDCPEIDVLAHPGLLEPADAALAKAHGTFLELSGRRAHSLANGHVAQVALAAGADLIVDSDAHAPDQLIPFPEARRIAAGAGLSPSDVLRAVSSAPRRLADRCRRG